MLYEKYRKIAYAKGLTDYAVSKHTGVAKQCLSDWKNGKHELSLGNRYKIAQFLGTDVDFEKAQ